MPRYTKLNLTYQGKSTQDIGTVEKFTYTDEACDNSDSISIVIDNIDNRWANGWTPKLNDKIQAEIIKYDVNNKPAVLKCGSFVVDDFSISGYPLTCSINATIKPINASFNIQPKSKVWKDVTIRQIASEITSTSGLRLLFECTKEDKIKELEQSNETDCSFLASLCNKYALQMKVYSESVIIYDEEKYEELAAVAKVTPSDCTDWNYNNSILGTYTGAIFSYTDVKANKTYTVSVGTSERLLYINESASDNADAEKKALARVNEANRNLITMSLTLKEPRFFVATNSIELIEFGGEINGKYFITKVEHEISSNGYTVSLDMRKLIARIGKATKEETKNSTGKEYIIKSGETLWGISKQFYGKGSEYKKIYEANKTIIEETAKKYGKRNSDNGNFIWGGTKIIIP
jgi:phage protein D|nr:MAG TPA: tail protein [Caudoviricetes sp.]